MNEPGTSGTVPVVRGAVVSDTDAIRTLCTAAEAAMSAFRGGDQLRNDTAIPGFVADSPDRIWLVAEMGECVIGMLTAHSDMKTLVVDRVYVEPAARAHGAGDALIAALVDVARARGISRVDGWALPGDRETKNLYERNGMTARAIVASRAVNDEAVD